MAYLKKNIIITNCLVVFFGGSFGGLVRLMLTRVPYIGSSPWIIVGINVVGSFLLAYVGARIPESYAYSLVIKNFIGTGIIGGFTTFSTFILQINQLVSQSFFISFAYIMTSIILAYIAALFGKKIGYRRGTN
ncbi:CrcB family protein [Leuconostoc sp. MTCC 10508]|uniref:fluoride efflux transporter FluC n=1 Tax=Leuconostoc sp. MTCC 10508 TaxID=2698683 RepID=UPI0020C046F0|nr:CrcB family protein [Leuconostoc sp. MTCC 10508]